MGELVFLRSLPVACISLVAAVLLYSFYILALTAIARSRSTRLRELSKEGYPGAIQARLVLTHTEVHLLSCQVGAFLAALCAGLVTDSVLLLSLSPEFIERTGFDSGGERFVFACIIIAVVALCGLICVQVAKAVAFTRPNRALCMTAVLILASSRVLWPLVWLLKSTVGRVLNSLGLNIPFEREIAISPEEINEIVEISSKAGQVEEDEREMIQHVFTFSDTLTREVMTQRKDIVSVDEQASLEEVVAVFLHERISRILVTGTDLDDVKGVLLAKDLLPLVGKESTDFQLKKIVRPTLFVPNSKKVDDLLQELRREAIHFAVVLDEHGGVDGVVTLEDLVEEIVGEIFDEFDSPVDEMDVQRTKSGELLVDGSTMVDDLNTQHALGIPRGPYDTIAGYVISALGRIPKIGETLKVDAYSIKVEEVAQNRITTVRITFEGRGRATRSSGTTASSTEDGTPPQRRSDPPSSKVL